MELEAARGDAPRRNDFWRKLRLEDRPLTSLKALDRPLVKGDAKRLAQAVKLATFSGWVPPVIINEQGEIIGEHLHYEVARELERGDATCVVVEGDITTDEIRLISVAMQQQGATAELDLDALRFQLIEIQNAGLPLELTGIEAPQLELLMAGNPEADPALDKEPLARTEVVSQPGDMWLLGQHKVLCADATDRSHT
jgi:hypothetical protein